MKAHRKLAAIAAAGSLAVGALIGAPAASAQQAGLVNVDIDVTDNQVLVQVPIGVAATVCGVNAAVIAQDFAQTSNPVCEADVTQIPVAFQPR